jgi:hypothetical protein
MLWVDVGIAVFAGIVAVLAALMKRPPRDLGLLSDQWLAQHRRES